MATFFTRDDLVVREMVFIISIKLTRDLVEMMDERGLKIAHSTILRWVLKYAME